MMHRFLTRFIFSTLTFQVVLGLNQSDGYNIGVVLGSVIAALLAVGIAGFLFYMFCIRRWKGVGEPAELGYSRQNNYNLKKQTGRPAFGYGYEGKAAPYGGGGGGGPREGGRRQGAANEVYQHDDHGRSHQDYPIGSGARYEVEGSGPPVVLSGGGSGSDHLRHSSHSPNVSYSSEEIRATGGAGRPYEVTTHTRGPGYEQTTTRTSYQARNYTGHAAGGNSPVPAAYLGTGV